MFKPQVQVFGVAVLLVLVSNAGAQLLNPISIDRYVEASAYWATASGGTPISPWVLDKDRTTAVGTTPFDATAKVDRFGVSASQKSTLTDRSISVSGSTYAWSEASDSNILYSSSESSLEEKFNLASPVTFTCHIQYDVFHPAFASAIAQLKGPGGQVFMLGTDSDGSPGFYKHDASGTLTPGVYTLRIAAGGSANWGELGSSSLSVSNLEALFTISPEPTSAVLLLAGCLLGLRRRRLR